MTDRDAIIENPSKYFAEPGELASSDQLTDDEKLAALRQWKLDAELLLEAEAENMAGGEHARLQAVNEALRRCQGAERNGEKPEVAQQYLAQIEAALASSPNVSQRQLEDLDEFRREVVQLCRLGKMDEAENACTLAIQTIKAGAPTKE